ncbi:hypothetical protein FEF65_05455 [Mariprofundus erugo]|uniref:ABC transporter substrate-binding protein n=1 Tax=Mariprofundus erugo TaxID=2528639 RepID=A0A5R9GY13_9PROT|nr:ABC transporter substrate binding protein [Mariprofundus erugo]TLS67894.1 hypothetical protein FEF65_05455 [Mariprofundus erugo]
MRRLLLFSVLLLLAVPMVNAVEVDVLLSERHRPHVEAVQAIQQGLRADDVRLFSGVENGDISEEVAQLQRIVERKPDLLIVVGEDALQAALQEDIRIPVLSVMSMTIRAKLQQRIPLTGIDLRPAPQMVADELSRLLAPGAMVLSYYNPEYSGDYVKEAAELFKKRGLLLAARAWPEGDIWTEMNNQMKGADCYWMQMEYKSVAPDTLRLLFALAKKGKTLVGLSEKYVRAGALLAWTPDVHQIGQQAAVMANRILAGAVAAGIPLEHPAHMRLSIRTPDSVVRGRE